MAEPITQASKKTKNRALWFVLAVLLLALLWWWSASSSNPQTAGRSVGGRPPLAATPVRVKAVEQGTLIERVTAIGTVQAFNTVTVRSRVEGELVSIEFKDGQLVETGQVLAKVDPRGFQYRLEQSIGQLKQNQAQLKIAETDLKRYRRLAQQNSISTQQLETQEATVQQLQGQVQASQAAVDDARLQLEYTQIKAPITGRLGLRSIDAGNLISGSATDGLVVITQTQPIAVAFSLPQQDLSRVFERMQAEQSLAVSVTDQEGATLSMGSLQAVDNQIDVDTGTVRMKASFPNTHNRLFPNQFVNVSVQLAEKQGLLIPTRALQLGSVGDFVYVVDDQKTVQIRKVEVELSDQSKTLIRSGLEEGEQVVVEGTDRLRAGTKVSIVTESTDRMKANTASKPEFPLKPLTPLTR